MCSSFVAVHPLLTAACLFRIWKYDVKGLKLYNEFLEQYCSLDYCDGLRPCGPLVCSYCNIGYFLMSSARMRCPVLDWWFRMAVILLWLYIHDKQYLSHCNGMLIRPTCRQGCMSVIVSLLSSFIFAIFIPCIRF